jgi:hypothetical protein
MKLTKKRQEQIFNFFKNKAIRTNYFFGRELILISKANFNRQKKWFVYSLSLNGHKNYRTQRFFKHIHAVEGKRYVEVHYDSGNSEMNIFLILIHLLFDVFPYFLYHFIKRKKPYNTEL